MDSIDAHMAPCYPILVRPVDIVVSKAIGKRELFALAATTIGSSRDAPANDPPRFQILSDAVWRATFVVRLVWFAVGKAGCLVSRFLSNFVMNVDRKGRVSVPAPFRSVLAQAGATELYTLKNLERPVVDAGGSAWLDELERPLDALDPLSEEYDRLSTFIHGDGAFVKFDDTGRLVLPDAVREHTGIVDQVAFVGRRTFFQIWEPERFAHWREQFRLSIAADRRAANLAASGA